MAREITMDDLNRRQATMLALMEQLPNERDTERITQISRQLEQEARDLEQLARDYERQELAKAGPPPRGSLEVVLTPAQRKRVLDVTGVKMETVVIRDE